MNENRASRLVRRAIDQERKESSLEWLAWSLQLTVGFLVGCGVGYAVWRLLFLGSVNDMLPVAAGCGLVCGAFTSFYGNRAWMAGSIFVASEAAPPRIARACSLLVGGTGAAVVLLTLIHHMIAIATQEHPSRSMDFDLFLLLSAVVPGFLLVHALRTGTGLWTFGIIEREETPLIFWVYVLLNGIAALSIISMVL